MSHYFEILSNYFEMSHYFEILSNYFEMSQNFEILSQNFEEVSHIYGSESQNNEKLSKF